MASTIYGTFQSCDNAERAAGALLDYGVRAEDISVVRKQDDSSSADSAGERMTLGDAAVAGSTGSVGSTAPLDPGMGMSSAAYGDAPGASADRFGADITGVHQELGTHGSLDSNGVAGENHLKVAGGLEPQARANDEQYDNLASLDEDKHSDDNDDPEAAAKRGITTTTASDAGAGAVKGTAFGAGIGAAAALASLFVPGLGIVLGGGALAAALGGIAASAGAGAVAGAVTGYLKDQGMDEQVASRYEAAMGQSGALIAVAVPSGTVDEHTVRSILGKYGAENIDAHSGRGYVA